MTDMEIVDKIADLIPVQPTCEEVHDIALRIFGMLCTLGVINND